MERLIISQNLRFSIWMVNPVIRFYYDKGNNRILMSLNDEMQFTYLDVINLLN